MEKHVGDYDIVWENIKSLGDFQQIVATILLNLQSGSRDVTHSLTYLLEKKLIVEKEK